MASFNNSSVLTDHWNVVVDEFEYEFDCYSKMCLICFRIGENANLTNAQGNFYFLHWKLDEIMHQIKKFKHVIMQMSQMENIP